jgi:hypothetical protein
MRSKIVLTAAAGLLLAGGGTFAAAAAPASPVDSGSLVHGCWTNAAINGSHAFVMQDAGTGCPKGTIAITWNQTGPQGPAGPAGPPGVTGVNGADGAAGPTGAAGPEGATGPPGARGDVGPAGPAGAVGTNGTNVLSGSGDPNGVVGANGDFYIDTAATVLYGPKAGDTWPDTGVSLVGPSGVTGPQGPAGPAGPTGSTGPQGPAGSDAPKSISGYVDNIHDVISVTAPCTIVHGPGVGGITVSCPPGTFSDMAVPFAENGAALVPIASWSVGYDGSLGLVFTGQARTVFWFHVDPV